MSRIYLHQAAEEKIFDSESSWARLGLLLIFSFAEKERTFFKKEMYRYEKHQQLK